MYDDPYYLLVLPVSHLMVCWKKRISGGHYQTLQYCNKLHLAKPVLLSDRFSWPWLTSRSQWWRKDETLFCMLVRNDPEGNALTFEELGVCLREMADVFPALAKSLCWHFLKCLSESFELLDELTMSCYIYQALCIHTGFIDIDPFSRPQENENSCDYFMFWMWVKIR